MLTFTLTILKYGLMAVGAGLGIHGVLHDYKVDGRLTRQGRKAIALMIVVAVLTLVAAGLEQYAAYQDHQEEMASERLGHPLKDLFIEFRISERQVDVFEQVMQSGGREAKKQGQSDGPFTYIGTAIRGGELEVTKTYTGWRLAMSLNRPQGPTGGAFDQSLPEWKSFERGIQRIMGDRFEMSTTAGTSVVDLAGAGWPMPFRANRSTLSFQVISPHLSPLDLKNSGVVFTLRGIFLPSEIRLRTSDPRIVLDQKFPITWTQKVWRMVPGAQENPEPIYEHVSDPLHVDGAVFKSGEKP
jgi:hypothetical protein